MTYTFEVVNLPEGRDVVKGRWVYTVKEGPQVVLLQTAHSWANAGVLLGARMHRERGNFRSN